MKRTAIVYMLDVSGSVDDAQRATAAKEVAALEAWLGRRSPDIAERFIVFDAMAKEVERERFFTTKESGGTMISAPLKRCAPLIEADYPPADWDVFAVIFTDGDNWSFDDTTVSIALMRERLLPRIVAFGLAQFETPYGCGAFIQDTKAQLGAEPRVVTSMLANQGWDFSTAFIQRVESLRPVAPIASPRKAPAKKKPAPAKKTPKSKKPLASKKTPRKR